MTTLSASCPVDGGPAGPATASSPIGLTMGDPAGIGPELILRVLSAPPGGLGLEDLVVYGDRRWLERRATDLGLAAPTAAARIVDCADVADDLPIGVVSAAAGAAAYRAVARAAADALAGAIRAVVTAPLNKAALNAAGHAFPGHTEILAAAAGQVPVRMMLENPELRTVLVSIHLPLKRAIEGLDTATILETIEIADRHLRRTGLGSPRIAVAGLNPHAGEGGLLGDEEAQIIAPAIAAARARGIEATGPWPPDTVFMRARGFAEHDVVIAMYHDQGLIPVKYLGVSDGVNVTVGLPFVRTSPDHGTAFDIAVRGGADPGSMLAAVRAADRMSRPRIAGSADRQGERPDP